MVATLLHFVEKIKASRGEGKVLFSLKYVEKVKSKSGVAAVAAAVGAAVSGMMDHRALPGPLSSSQLHTHTSYFWKKIESQRFQCVFYLV